MATGDILQVQGTDVVWADSAQTPDENLTLSALADGGGRAGDEHDFGATHPSRARVSLNCSFSSAPTAGNQVFVYWSSSHDGTDYDGECTGSDAAFDAEEDQQRLHYVGTLMVSNDTNAQRASWIFFLPARYGLPVVSNQAGQAFTTSTSAHNVTVTPLYDQVQS